ncbi:MAG: type II toxin-antitoxin system VapC family toxin, partial [Fimbriimonadales bacterium]
MYLDSAVVIYLVEGVEPYYTRLQTMLDPSDYYYASHLTRLECRVLPLRKGDTQLLADYDAFFSDQIHDVVELNARVMDQAAEIRASHRFGIADSIQLAAAIVS